MNGFVGLCLLKNRRRENYILRGHVQSLLKENVGRVAGPGVLIVKRISSMNTSNQDKNLYICAECRLHYKDKEWAEKCEKWCKKHKSCNLEIIDHAEESKDGNEI